MTDFRDVLYGHITVPAPLEPFLKIPEFIRLRGVRLSNVDSYQFKDFNGPTRWEHAVGVVHLAMICARARGLNEADSAELALAGLLHDVATPPFAHTAEYVLPGFDHERETATLLSGRVSIDVFPDAAIYQSELPGFRDACRRLSRILGPIDADRVASMVVGGGERGYLISGTLDLDNIDNVTRACFFMGFDVDRKLPERLAVWLAHQKAAPLNLRESDNPDVREWVSYRDAMYSAFFSSLPEEKAREAFLQHLFRRGAAAGVPRRRLIWNTDEGLLQALAGADAEGRRGPAATLSLKELVRRYRLLDTPRHLVSLPVSDEATLRTVQAPQMAAWLERTLSTEWLEAIVTVNVRRYAADDGGGLFPPVLGEVIVYKIGTEFRSEMLPDWLRSRLAGSPRGKRLEREVQRLLAADMAAWVKTKPWLADWQEEEVHVVGSLEAVGDWSFRQSRNENFHVYPGTYVHAIPASLISALGLKGASILDPFGGTGQTAVEAIKYGCEAVSVDSSSIASLVSRARLTYLTDTERSYLRDLSFADLLSTDPADLPQAVDLERWFHPATLLELRQLKGFVDTTARSAYGDFLLACFSAVLTSVSGRRGKQHAYFADNTPLSRGLETPAYVDATAEYLHRVSNNLRALESFYAFIERDGRDPKTELRRVRVVHGDALSLTDDPTHDAIITSPPYLCMADYSLGNRLSYYWLDQAAMQSDYAMELGARRQRFSPGKALHGYLAGMRRFADVAHGVLRPGGYLATVIGAPLAKAFAHVDVINEVDRSFQEAGLVHVWQHWRDVSWHRNHGYQRLASERIAVFRKRE